MIKGKMHFKVGTVYEGEFKGNMLEFHLRDPNSYLLAAGIWEEWVDKSSGECFESFSTSVVLPEPILPQTAICLGIRFCRIYRLKNKRITVLAIYGMH